MVDGDKISTPLGGVKANKVSGRFALVLTRGYLRIGVICIEGCWRGMYLGRRPFF